MELWIRGQDKTKLKKINEIVLSVAGGTIFCNKEIFGEYETRKRALEVLNEIQKMLDGRWIKEKIPSATMQNIFPIMLYEMPEK